MTQHVGQRLLNDPEGRSTDCGRDDGSIDPDIHIGKETGGADVVDEPRERFEAERRRRWSGVAVVTREAEGRAQIA